MLQNVRAATKEEGSAGDRNSNGQLIYCTHGCEAGQKNAAAEGADQLYVA